MLYEEAHEVITKIEKQVLVKNVHIEESKQIAQSMLELRLLIDETIKLAVDEGREKPSLNEKRYTRCSRARNGCIEASLKVRFYYMLPCVYACGYLYYERILSKNRSHWYFSNMRL